MAVAVVSTTNGLPVSSAPAPFGYPVTVSTNGFGLAVTPVASGGRPVFDTSGTLFGGGVTGAPNWRLPVSPGVFALAGELMASNVTYGISAALGAIALGTPVTNLLRSTSYQGPGDIITTGAVFFGSSARAYTQAFASTAAPIMDIVDSAGVNPATINILTTGFVDKPTLTAWIAAHGTASVTKLYDQTGSGNHVTNVTLAQMPTINMTALNSLPGMVFTSAAASRLLSGNISVAQPLSLATVAMKTIAGSGSFIGSSAGTMPGMGPASTNLWGVSAGTAFTVAATDNVFHSGLALIATTGSLSIDGGAATTGSVGTGSMIANPVSVGRGSGASIPGTVMEAMIWAGDKSANFAALNSNMHGTNGYNF